MGGGTNGEEEVGVEGWGSRIEGGGLRGELEGEGRCVDGRGLRVHGGLRVKLEGGGRCVEGLQYSSAEGGGLRAWGEEL